MGDGKKGKRKTGKFNGHSKNKFSKPCNIENPANHQLNFAHQKFIVRKQVDPDTTKYFSEIANLFESNGVDLDERAVICGNALEEAVGKELELATDYIISHTLEMLLEGCDVDHLCSFLQSCANDFPYIAMDRSGSHVAESAVRSLALHLQDSEAHSLIEDTLTVICKVIVENPGDVMSNCYGSHVVRSLLYLCKGLPLNSSKSDVGKSSKALADRLNFKAPRAEENASAQVHQGFPDLLRLLVSGILDCTQENMKTLQVGQYSSLVLQAVLKMLVGDEAELLKIIPVLLQCQKENATEGNSLESSKVQHVVHLVKETAFSHLMEVILEVAPEVLYNEILTKVFKNSLFELSSHQSGNFVVQALVSHARHKDHMELIWDELGPKFKDILGMGKSGVIASIIAATQRLHTHEQKCCEALVAAVGSANGSPTSIVSRILFLDTYLYSRDKTDWNWPRGVRMHVVGSLILQEVFRYPSAFAQPFITSLLSLEADNILETAKDSGGVHVIEAFLNSHASVKMKRRLVSKLRGHFGELSMHLSGSFTVEKCFSNSNMSLQETIVSELSAVQSELSKTKHGPHLIRKLDVEGFTTRPDQWRSRQASKLSTYKEFQSTFGSAEVEPSKNENFLSYSSKKTQQPEGMKKMMKEIGDSLTSPTSPVPFLSTSRFKHNSHKPENHRKSHNRFSVDDGSTKGKNNKSKNNNQGYAGKTERKRFGGDIPIKAPKKLRT